MQDVVIVAPRGVELSTFERMLEPRGWSLSVSADQISIESGDVYARLVRDDTIGNASEDDDLAEILRSIPDPVFFDLIYNDFAFAREVLLQVADTDDFLIEDMVGPRVHGSDYARKLRADPDWNPADEVELPEELKKYRQ